MTTLGWSSENDLEMGESMQSEESSKRHVVCAIITPNYLKTFLILGESVAAAMPTVDLRVLALQDCAEIAPIQIASTSTLSDYRPPPVTEQSRFTSATGATSTLSAPPCFTTSWSSPLQ